MVIIICKMYPRLNIELGFNYYVNCNLDSFQLFNVIDTLLLSEGCNQVKATFAVIRGRCYSERNCWIH